MAGSIQGLTVIINGDATRLTKAMREARAEAGILRGHMSQIGKLLTFNPANATLLTRQQQLLGQSVLQTSERLRTLRSSYAQLAPTVSSMTSAQLRQFMSLQREITATELKMAELRSMAIQTGAAGSIAMQQWAGRMASVNAAIKSVSTQLMMVSAVSGLISYASLKAAVNFESSFAGVRKTIIATEAEYKKLAADAIALSLVKPVDVNDINRIMELGGQLNIASQYLTKFAGVMADLNVSTDMNIEDGSLALAQFVNITGIAQNDVDRLGAVIVDLGNNSATTENRIMQMAMRIAGASSNLGMSAQNTLALAASLSAVGIQAEMGGNAIATIMNKINKDVAADNHALSTWAETAGMSASQFKESWSRDVTGTLLQIFKGMGQFRDEGNNLNVLLREMGVSYMRQVDTMQRLSRASDLTTTLIARSNVAWDQNSALVREATQRYSTAESRMQLMKNSINAIGISLGQQILPAFAGIVDGVARAVQAFADMDDGFKQAAVGALLFITAIGPVSKSIQYMTGGISAAIKGFMSLKTAMALASTGQLTFTNLTIASSAATLAEAEARAANLSAIALQQRGYVSIISAKAAEAAASGNSALASTLDATAKGLEAVATESEAKAEEQAAVATMANASAKSFLATATAFATAQTLPFAAALAMTNIELVALVAVIAGLAIATGMAISSIAKSSDPLEKLSASYAEQEQHVKALQTEYDELRSSESATEEEIWKAQAALDAESASLEANSITVREFNENVKRMSENQADLAVKSDDAMRSAQDEAGSIGNLVDKIRELEPSAKDSAEGTQDLLLAISQLNMIVPELELSWDSTTGTLKSAAGAWDEVALAAGRAKDNAAAMEQLNTWTLELSKSQSALDEAQKNLNSTFNMSIDDLNAMHDAGIYLGAGFEEMLESYNLSNAAVGEATVRIRAYSDEVKRTHDEQTAYTDVIGQLASGKMDLAQATEYLRSSYGMEVSEAQIVEERSRRLEAAERETSAAIDDVASAVADAREKYPQFATAMDVAGVSSENLSRRLADLGLDAAEVAKQIEDFVNKATDGFNRLDTESAISLNDFMENVRHNAEASNDFANNLSYLYSVAETDAEIKLITKLKEGGVEEASTIVRQLADDSREGLSTFADTANEFASLTESAETSSMGLVGTVADSIEAFVTMSDSASSASSMVSSVMSSMTEAISGNFDEVTSAAGTKAAEAMQAYASGIANGTAPAEASNISQSVRANLEVGDTYSIGANAAAGVAAGLRDGLGEVEAAAAAIAAAVASASSAALQINSPSKVMRRIYRSVGEGAALGIMDGLVSVKRASTLLADASVPNASSTAALVGIRANEAAMARMAPQGDIVSSSTAKDENYYITVNASGDGDDIARAVTHAIRAQNLINGRR